MPLPFGGISTKGQYKYNRLNRKDRLSFMVTDQPTDSAGDRPKPASGIEALEERRGSLPLAQLKTEEEEFFTLVDRGNLPAIEKFLSDHRTLNINCVNYKGLSALHIAIKKEIPSLVDVFFKRLDLEIKDAALHSVATGNTELTEIILDAIKARDPGREMKGCEDSSDYTSDITPLILAAQLGDYKMVRMLLDRGHNIEKPHVPTCLCARCKELIKEAGAALSRNRLNAYKAISNPSYICQVTDDPVLYGFLLDREVEGCSRMEKEYKTEYIELGQEVRDFTVELLSKCRNPSEIELLLRLPWGYEGTQEKVEFPRLQLALDNKQKEFVAHPMVQQVLTSYFLGEFTRWNRIRLWQKCMHVLLRTILLPFLCIFLIFAPPHLKFIRKCHAPINRYLLNLSSYFVFLLSVFLLNLLDTGNFTQGPPKTGFEIVVIFYILGFILCTIRQIRLNGFKRFFSIPWNWYDILMELLYVTIFLLWLITFIDTVHGAQKKEESRARKYWDKYDPTLLHQGLFAVATILSFGKLAYYCLQSSRLGPLQVSMGKMLAQIGFFLLFCFLIITSFSIPMARSYAYYTGMTQTAKDGTTRTQLPSFSSFRSSFSTFFWAMFCMSPVESTEVVVENLVTDKNNPVINSHDFTETVGAILFGTYELIMVIALLNTLIAILSNTFQKVVDNADVEFKFARTKLWMYFLDEATIAPPPFNLIPSRRFFVSMGTFCSALAGKIPGATVSCNLSRCCYVRYEKEQEVDRSSYETLLSSLVQRYFRAKEEE